MERRGVVGIFLGGRYGYLVYNETTSLICRLAVQGVEEVFRFDPSESE